MDIIEPLAAVELADHHAQTGHARTCVITAKELLDEGLDNEALRWAHHALECQLGDDHPATKRLNDAVVEAGREIIRSWPTPDRSAA